MATCVSSGGKLLYVHTERSRADYLIAIHYRKAYLHLVGLVGLIQFDFADMHGPGGPPEKCFSTWLHRPASSLT